MLQFAVVLYREVPHYLYIVNFSTFSSVCWYHLSAFENPHLLHITQWIITPTLSYRHSQCCFYASILYYATTWWIVSFISLQNLHRGDTLCLWTLLFMMFVFSAWSCAVISIPSVSFLNEPVLIQFQVSWLCTWSIFNISFLVFPPSRLPSPSAAFSSLLFLFSIYLFRLCVSIFTQASTVLFHHCFRVCRVYQHQLEDGVFCGLSFFSWSFFLLFLTRLLFI